MARACGSGGSRGALTATTEGPLSDAGSLSSNITLRISLFSDHPNASIPVIAFPSTRVCTSCVPS